MAEKESISNKLIETIKERTYSPFLIYFFVSWVFYNHEIIIYLLDKRLGADEKIQKIASHLDICHTFLYPLGYAVGLFIIWCGLHFLTSICWDYVRQYTKYVTKKYIRRIPVVAESEIDKKNYELQSSKRQYDQIILDKDARIDSLSKEITNLKDTNKHVDEIVDGLQRTNLSIQTALMKARKSYGELYVRQKDDIDVKSGAFPYSPGDIWCTFIDQNTIDNDRFTKVINSMNGNVLNYGSEAVQFTRVSFPKGVDLNAAIINFSNIGFTVNVTTKTPDPSILSISDIANLK